MARTESKPPFESTPGMERLDHIEKDVKTMSAAFVTMTKLPLCPSCSAARAMVLRGVLK